MGAGLRLLGTKLLGLVSGELGVLGLRMGLGFLDTVTGLLETTAGLELLAAASGLDVPPTVTGLKLFPGGLETSLADTLLADMCVGLLASVLLGGFTGLETVTFSTCEISEVTVSPSSFCWMWEY